MGIHTLRQHLLYFGHFVHSLSVSHEHGLSLQLDVDPVLLLDDLLQLLPLLPLKLLGDPEVLQLRLSRPLARGQGG